MEAAKQNNWLMISSKRQAQSVSRSVTTSRDSIESLYAKTTERRLQSKGQETDCIGRLSTEDGLGCGICFESASKLKGSLIIPCQCSEPSLLVHQSCLRKQIAEKGSYYCGSCHFDYLITFDIHKSFCI